MSFKDALLGCLHGNNKPNIHRAIPQSRYRNTSEYYKEKLGERLPDVQYELMELQARPDLHENDDYLNQLREQALFEYNKLMEEFKEKEEEGKNDPVPEIKSDHIFYAIENDSEAHITHVFKSIQSIKNININ